MMNNLVSIIIPTFNRSSLIGATLDSVINQTFSNWECLIVDDGSNDYSAELIQFYCERDPRIIFYKRPVNFPKGSASCRNYGFSVSKGNLIQWLDDDDLLSPEKLSIQEEFHRNNTNFTYSVCSWGVEKNGKTLNLHNSFKGEKIVSPERFFKILGEKKTFIPIHAYLISSGLLKLSGEWNPYLRINQDAEYFTRVHLTAGSLLNIDNPECYVLYRKHDGERISLRFNMDNFDSLMMSHKLIYSHLNRKNINAVIYFHWKLGELIKAFGKNYTGIRKERVFFSRNGISLNWYNYKNIKMKMYRVLIPVYKKVFSKNRKKFF